MTTTLFKEHNTAKANFPVRHPQFKFKLKENDRYWYGGEPAMTHFMNSLQAFFPDLEMLMINAVRSTRSQIKDPNLLKDISAFIGQEAQHAAKHREFNAFYQELYNNNSIVKLESFYKRIHEWTEKNLTDRQRLALTLAFEHFTGLIAPIVMRREDMIKQMESRSPEAVWVAMWHAVEECEHKAVAFDAYMATGGGYSARAASVITMSILGLSMVLGGTIYLMFNDKQLFNWKSWKQFLGWGFGNSKGFAYQVFFNREYFDWFRPGFHPHDHDTSEIERYWKQRLGILQNGNEFSNSHKVSPAH
jgi:predicted metal-dependent hydrolase